VAAPKDFQRKAMVVISENAAFGRVQIFQDGL